MGGETFLTPDGGTDYSLKDVVSAGYLPLSVFLNGKEMKEGRDFRFVVSGRKMTLKMAKPVGLEEELYVVVDDPTYEQVCSKISGHAEVIQVEYDPEVISFDVLLQVFWKTHDPTTLNRQGNDVGPQYRSAVFFHNDSQREKATTYKKKLNETKAFSRPVVTEISQATKFYVAEDYHQNYFERNSGNPYCRMLIPPKLEKLKAVFGDQLKK
ncbi:MAG: peptide-methionine (S)-S-oxide reductase MsrA [Planctomycetaceae bacterium]|nr:peptide-methionine (S)-S-oxide reductase MsrA [Planctomycetaceae bacterium]MCP4477549.1 peptide-methionine (S)-S-oxide reductase MsrA [Planctomycetaceae bacterium]MCP4774623.1 peptide-methionine (S)-S-oxide reductase MsrA [Planctomycetaceae bacterium]